MSFYTKEKQNVVHIGKCKPKRTNLRVRTLKEGVREYKKIKLFLRRIRTIRKEEEDK
jgi:hypothetical protein